jgi:hypothetical protein
MKALGFFIAFIGWLTSIEGYTIGHIAMIIVGLSMVLGGLCFERR